MHVRTAALALTTLLATLACGGAGAPLEPAPGEPAALPAPVSAPAPAEPEGEPLAGPVSTQSASLVLLRPDGEHCQVVRVELPSLAESELAPCACGGQGALFFAPDGKRLLAGPHLCDLEAGAWVELPEVPDRGEPIDAQYRFAPDGRVFVHASWGIGEPEWGEGPYYPTRQEALLDYVDGAWVDRASIVAGEDSAATDEELTAFTEAATAAGSEVRASWDGPDGTFVEDGPLKEALDGFVSEDAEYPTWFADDGEPRLAWMYEQIGEGEELSGPPRVLADGTWQALPTPEYLSGLDRRGPWVLASGAGWVLVDLGSREVVARGDGEAWFWPDGVP